MEFETTVDIAAPRATVWKHLADVEHWADLTASITSIDLSGKPLEVGAKAIVVQPKLRPATYTVIACTSGEEFTWETRLPGVTIVASHVIAGPDEGPVTMTLRLKQTGFLSPIVSLMYGKLTRKYVTAEAVGFKKASEAA